MLFHSWHQCTLSRNRDIEGESNSLYNMNCVHYSMIFRKDGDITTPSERKLPEESMDDTSAPKTKVFIYKLSKVKRWKKLTSRKSTGKSPMPFTR